MRARSAVLCVFAAGVSCPFAARAIDFNFAGSLQLDYLFAPFGSGDPRPARNTLDGFTHEISLKVAADFSHRVSANVKACFGCHGLMMGMAYVDLRLAEGLTVRAGRFSPTFGEFGNRHDPGNHRLSDKPLPYDMGRMLRMLEFGGRGVFPSPYVDNGVEVSGSHFFGRRVQLDWAVHAVAGMRALLDQPYDIDFQAMRQGNPFYIDNNSQPSVGGRVGLTFRLAPRAELTVGGSALYGPYDNNGQLDYTVFGADTWLRLGRTNIRGEYLVRRTEMAPDNPMMRFAEPVTTGPGVPVPQTRDGWYVEVEQPLRRNLDLILRWDGLRRRGNVPVVSSVTSDAGVSRWTLGAHVTLERGYRLKASVQHYSWWGLRSGVTQDWGFHLGAVATF